MPHTGIRFLLKNLFRRTDPRGTMKPLYASIVAEARRPDWYRAGVPDSVDGRFDMVASVVALVLLRLEREGPQTRDSQTLLTETFVDDMDGELRQMGIGDLVVGKHVGKMMGTLGGRISTFKDGLAGRTDLAPTIARNLFRDEAAEPGRVAAVETLFRGAAARIDAAPLPALLRGELG